ncbi:MAG: hypothetical protein EP338_07870 [Bacteroidetes bacterium]|nr:MAG: hypothetical protein EP338_07870 [Bacteroidota bacterium]
MKTTLKLVLSIFLFAVLISGCKDGIQDYTFVELDDSDTTYFNQESDSLKLFGLGKGPTWRMWKDLHKGCMKNEWLAKSKYFGVSNTLKLGTITDKKFEQVYNSFDGIFTDDQIAYIIDEGAAQPCDYIRKISFDLESELDMEVGGQNQELSLFLDNKTNTNVQINGWQQQNVNTDRLIEVLNSDESKEDPKLQRYAKRLMEKDSRLLSTVVKINGFTSVIQSTKKISSDLKLKLEANQISSLIGNTGINVNFQYVDSLTIKTTTNTSFYVFGRYLKSKKL